MKIDTHQHFWKYSKEEYPWIGEDMEVLAQDRLPPDLKPLLTEHGIEGTVAVQARQVVEETEALLAMAEEYDFNTAASMLGMQVSTTGPVAQGGFIPGIGYEPQVVSFGLASRVGEISEVLEHTSAYYVVQVRDKLDAGIAPLDDVRAEIEDQLLWDKQIANLADLAEQAAQDMKARPDGFSDLAGEYGFEVVDTGTFTRNDFVTGVGRDPEFIAVAFTTPVGEVAGPFKGENGWYIIRVREHSDVSGEGIQSLVEAERSRLLSERRRTAFTTWLQGLRARARITDNRAQFGF